MAHIRVSLGQRKTLWSWFSPSFWELNFGPHVCKTLTCWASSPGSSPQNPFLYKSSCRLLWGTLETYMYLPSDPVSSILLPHTSPTLLQAPPWTSPATLKGFSLSLLFWQEPA